MKHSNNSLLQIFKEHGIDAGMDRIEIDKVDDSIVKIILQTIYNSKIALFKELETRISKKNQKNK